MGKGAPENPSINLNELLMDISLKGPELRTIEALNYKTIERKYTWLASRKKNWAL